MPDYKYSFKNPTYEEVCILKEDGKLLGNLRLKPSSVLWKPASAHQYYAVPINKFTEWIMSKESGAKRAKQ